LKQSFKTKLRQLWFPAEFRLPAPEFTKEQLDLLEELIQLIQPTLSQEEKATRDERISMARFLIDLGTGVWRIRRKIEGLSRMPKEIKDALYSLESTWASMSEGGVEIVDHSGTIPLKNEAKVVEVREIPNLTRDQVIETVKPTIMFKGEVIQVGEVVMGRAVKPEIPSPSRRAAPVMAEETRENLEKEPEFPEAQPIQTIQTIQPEAPEADEGVSAASADENQDLPDELETAAPQEEVPLSDEAEAGEGPEALESALPITAEVSGEQDEPEETRAPDEGSAHGEALPEAIEESAEFIESSETAEAAEMLKVPDEPEATSENVPGAAEPEAKPKKKRAPRKAKAPESEETEAKAAEEPKPKRARKSKKKAGETTEVNDAG
jgi:hypothetical protein